MYTKETRNSRMTVYIDLIKPWEPATLSSVQIFAGGKCYRAGAARITWRQYAAASYCWCYFGCRHNGSTWRCMPCRRRRSALETVILYSMCIIDDSLRNAQTLLVRCNGFACKIWRFCCLYLAEKLYRIFLLDLMHCDWSAQRNEGLWLVNSIKDLAL